MIILASPILLCTLFFRIVIDVMIWNSILGSQMTEPVKRAKFHKFVGMLLKTHLLKSWQKKLCSLFWLGSTKNVFFVKGFDLVGDRIYYSTNSWMLASCHLWWKGWEWEGLDSLFLWMSQRHCSRLEAILEMRAHCLFAFV